MANEGRRIARRGSVAACLHRYRIATLGGMPDSAHSNTLSPLLDMLSRKAIPWAEQGGMQRVVIARRSYSELVLPADVHVSQKKLVSSRKGVRGTRMYGNISVAKAQWTEDDQEEVRVSSLICVLAGQADFQIGDYILHCPEGTFIFVPPGLPHPRGGRSHLEGANRSAGSCDLLWFSPRGRRVQVWTCYSRGSKHTISKGHESVFPLDDRLVQYMDSMEEEADGTLADYDKMFQSALRMLLVATHRVLKSGRYLPLGSEEDGKLSRKKDYDPIVQAQDYIRAHLGAVLTIDRVSTAVHMSRAQFTRRFLAQTGCTFTEFINQCRLEQAKKFLRDTDWAVSQISEFVGFRSTAYFHTLFRRHFNASPLEFRRTNQTVESATGSPLSE